MPDRFTAVGSTMPYLAMEQRLRDFWRERRIFQRSIEERPADNLYTFYEGPPTANGTPGVHHVLSRVYKDLFPRYKTMRGYRAPRKAGWDTHGLAVELELERELGLRTKARDRGIRHRRVQPSLPGVGDALRLAVARHDGADRLLGGHGRRLRHVRRRLHRDGLVDLQGALGRGPDLRSATGDAALPAL